MAVSFSLENKINLLATPGRKDEYHSAMIQEIKKARSSGMKICLFMCRVESEALPIEKGKLYLSADKRLTGPIPAGRIHLWVDLRDKKELEKFHQLFDEIVVDQSSVKGFAGSEFIPNFVMLFYPSPEAVFIFENTFDQSYPEKLEQPVTSAYDIKWPKNQIQILAQKKHEWVERTYIKGSSQYLAEFNQFSDKVKGIAEKQKWDKNKYEENFRTWTMAKFPENLDPGYSVKNEANEKRRILLGEFFQTVELFINQLYPYETKYRSQKDCYYVATGIKTH